MAMKRGPVPGLPREPLFPERVLEIVHLRDDCNLSYAEIAPRVGCTRMNCCALYNRWRAWAQDRRVAAE